MPVELYKVYLQLVRPEISDPYGMGAIVGALKFFEWVLLSMRESDFRKATCQFIFSESNPEVVTPALCI